MKVIIQRCWREPAVFIGLVTSLALLALALIDGASLDATQIISIVAPFASSLGIRQLVTPTSHDTPVVKESHE